MTLFEKVSLFPRKSGVYLFKDAKGTVLYIGKAKRLRNRVRGYFIPGRDNRPQVAFLLKRTADIDFIVTDTEKEALLLENTLIKKHRPRYNVSLRDDKSYISICIDSKHDFPSITLTRRVLKDGATYFGPYDSATAARGALDLITRFFRIRTCADVEFANRVRPCLKHDIGRCTAPCVSRISREDYSRRVEEAELFLSGQSSKLISLLETEMQRASEDLHYEEAARLRDIMSLLHNLLEHQKVVRYGGSDHDVIGFTSQGERAAICSLKVRGGVLLAKRSWILSEIAGSEGEAIEEFLLSRYREGTDIPSKIFLSHRTATPIAIEELLSERRLARVKISVPKRGEMLRLVKLAITNAREVLAQRRADTEIVQVLERLGVCLGLSDPPDRIECVDISNLGGREAVGSLVAFLGGQPDKANYRIYNIRALSTPDDYAMMHEVLIRRFSVKQELRTISERPIPDLLIVDGGKGQLAIAKRVVDEIGLPIPVAAIAKGKKKGRADQIFIPNRKNPLKLKRGSKELLFLMRIRDEAHRFGIKAHRKRREKAALSSRK